MKKKPVADGQLHPANIGDLFDEGLDYNQPTPAEALAEARRVSLDNANIAMKAIGMFCPTSTN